VVQSSQHLFFSDRFAAMAFTNITLAAGGWADV